MGVSRVTLLVIAGAIAVGVALIPHERSESERQSAELAQAQEQRPRVPLDDARDVDALNERIGSAVTTVVDAQHDDDRAAARAKLDALRKQKYVLEQRIAAAKAAAARPPHICPRIRIPPQCFQNPLAKGCN